jgi:hypothetical protein
MDERAEQLIGQSAASILADGAADGHDHRVGETLLVFSAAGGSSRSTVELRDLPAGELVGSWVPSEPSEALLESLREAMSRPELGTWYWLAMRIGPLGEVDCEFHYDELPEWQGTDFQLAPGDYRVDMEMYPRAEPPAWISELTARSD